MAVTFPITPLRLRRPLSHLPGRLDVVRQFTPHWFAVTMGTGVLALALGQWPGQPAPLTHVGEAFWLLDVVLFLLCATLYSARWMLFYQEARRVFGHPTVSMFLGTIPMGLATLLNGLVQYGLPRWGELVLPWAYALWWLDAGLALVCGVTIPFLMFTRQEHRIDQMTAVWLLPVVAAEVAAVSGATLVPHLTDAATRFQVLVASYALWAYSVPVALSILVILMLRLALHKLPPASMAASSWLALGPLGTAALGMLLTGAQAPATFAAQGLGQVGQVAAGVGLVAGLLFWGLGLWWLSLAALITLRYLKGGLPFNLGWWGFTFPIGVYALATLKLGALLHLAFLDRLGETLVVLLAGLWLLVASRTAAGAYRGTLFVSPCIAAHDEKPYGPCEQP